MSKQYDSEKDVLLLGAGGHAAVIAEALKKYYRQYNIIGITDSDRKKTGQTVAGIPVIGTDELLEELYKCKIRKAFISVGAVYDLRPRLDLFNLAKKVGFEFINVIHGTSVISGYSELGCGNAVLANTVVNIGARIGNNCILNTGSIVEHQCIIGDNVHIATGSVICGGARIGDNCLVGAGATVIQGVSIGENSIIGAGSVVIGDIPPGAVAVGVPVKIIKKR